jgi:hypothetical protein
LSCITGIPREFFLIFQTIFRKNIRQVTIPFRAIAPAHTIAINTGSIPLPSLRRAKIPINQDFLAKITLNIRPLLTPHAEGCQGLFRGRSYLWKAKAGSGSKLTHLLGSKSEGIVRVFCRTGPKYRISGKWPNRGVLRGFPERYPGNRSLIQAYFS